MKEILLTFKTLRGRRAYKSVCDEGKRESWKNKLIMTRFQSELIISENPLVVMICFKLPKVALTMEMDKKVVESLKKYDAIQNEDYDLEVKL